MLQVLLVICVLPLVAVLGGSFLMGSWLSAQRLFTFLKKQGCTGQSAFVVTLGVSAVFLALLIGPARLLGAPGYALDLFAFLGMVLVGAPHMWRLKEFLRRELNDDPTDDIDIPNKGLKKPEEKDEHKN